MKSVSRQMGPDQMMCARFVCVGCALAIGAWSSASPPLEPIPVPLYSFDINSPSIGSNGVVSDGVLRKESAPYPVVAVDGANIGLGQPEDDIDGLSFNRASAFGPMSTFVVMFSVDRQTTGDTPPDPALIMAETPFNVADQAMRGHAAGDAFVSHNLFTREGIVLPSLRSPAAASNTQALNNYDEGGHDFEAAPQTSSRDLSTEMQDNVNGMATEPVSSTGFRGLRNLPGLYFTVTKDSLSLSIPGGLPGESGADIFFDPDPDNPQSPIQLYVSGLQLGLDAMPPFQNDIGGITIIDEGIVGVFDQGDLILFSLTRGSPALLQIPGVSSNGAADVLAAFVGADGVTRVRVFAPADALGLEGQFDSIDALELVECPTDPVLCAEVTGIRLVKGDWDNDAIVSAVDVPEFVWCLSGPREGAGYVLPGKLCRDVFDFNLDTDVDLHDFARFQEVFGP